MKRELPNRSAYAVADVIKRSGGLPVGEIATRLGMSYMGVKAQCLALDKSGQYSDRHEFIHPHFAAPQIAPGRAQDGQHQNDGPNGGADIPDGGVQRVEPGGEVGVNNKGRTDANPEKQAGCHFVIATGTVMFVSVAVGLHGG